MANSDLCGLGAIALHELKNVDCLEHEIRRLNGEIANLEGEFEHDISIFGQLTKRKAELERNVSSLSELSTLEHIKLKQVIFDSRQNNIVGKFMARMDEYANISGSVHEEQFKLLESYRELEALVTEVLSLPISDAKFRLRSMQEEVASKKTEVLVSNESMHSIELKMRDKISVIQNLRGLNSEKRVRLSDEVNCCNNLRAILLKTSEDLNSAIQMIEEDKEKNASSWQNLVCEVDQLRSDIVVLKDSVSFIAKLHTETREEYERVLNELELLPPNIQQKSALVDHAKEKIREIHAKTSNSVRSIEENKAEIARLHEDISKSKEARSSGVSPIAQVQEQRDELTRSICYLNDRLSKLKTEVKSYYIHKIYS
jgi:chromosome segregation ATPase